MNDNSSIEKIADSDSQNRELVLVNSQLVVTVLPAMGGKISGIERKKSGTQFLQQAEGNYHNVPLPEYGESFFPPYAAGFDDCFPTVSPCSITLNGEIIHLPDHGELWTSRWEAEQSGPGMKLTTDGKNLNYRFTKWIHLDGNSLTIRYRVENLSDSTIPFIWSSHPLLNVDPEDELILPSEINEVLVDGMTEEEIGQFGDRISWQDLKSKLLPFDLSIVQPKEVEFAGKFFSDKLQTGVAGIYRKQTDESLLFKFDTAEIPCLGIWLCYGGWPENSEKKDLTAALEPCIGRPDSLEKAIKWGENLEINPSEKHEWSVKITIEDGKSKIL
jgi:galactose mutarotase-like enzyme